MISLEDPNGNTTRNSYHKQPPIIGEGQAAKDILGELWNTPRNLGSEVARTSSSGKTDREDKANHSKLNSALAKHATSKLSWGGVMNTLSVHRPDRILSPEEIRRRKNPGAVALGKFSKRTSLAGVPYIIDTTSHIHRAFWVLICLAAGGATFYQLVLLFQDYSSYPYTSSINDVNKPLEFPSITICNSNIVRKRKMDDLPPSVVQFLHQYAPQTEFNYELRDRNDTNSTTVKRRRKREVEEEISSTEQLLSEYQEVIGNLSRELRTEVGHQLKEFVLDCTYDGYICTVHNFYHFLSDKYGNCYTFNSAEIQPASVRVSRSGSRHGLNVELYLEKNQYLPGFTDQYGAHLVVHEFGTFPTIDETSFGLAPGQITFVAMSASEYFRLGAPWNPCGDTSDYSGYFNVTYSQQGCQSTCADRHIATNCSCVRPETSTYNPVYVQESLPKCQDKDEMCMYPIELDEFFSNLSCGCRAACHERVYSLSSSTCVWPSEVFYYGFVDEACAVIDEDECQYLRSKNSTVVDRTQALRENFLKFSVYYDSLTVVEITEQSVYSTNNLLADLGGTLGLYIGATLMNIIEFIDFLLQLSYECCKCCHRKGKKRKNKRASNKDSYNRTQAGFESSSL